MEYIYQFFAENYQLSWVAFLDATLVSFAAHTIWSDYHIWKMQQRTLRWLQTTKNKCLRSKIALEEILKLDIFERRNSVPVGLTVSLLFGLLIAFTASFKCFATYISFFSRLLAITSLFISFKLSNQKKKIMRHIQSKL